MKLNNVMAVITYSSMSFRHSVHFIPCCPVL